MENDQRDLITSLCTEIGSIMEDMSTFALATSGRDDELNGRLAQIGTAISEMSAFLSAACALACQVDRQDASLTS